MPSYASGLPGCPIMENMWSAALLPSCLIGYPVGCLSVWMDVCLNPYLLARVNATLLATCLIGWLPAIMPR